MSDSRLQEFCRVLKPPAKYTETCERVTREVFDLLVRNSRYPITDYIIGGGLPIAKNTSTCMKADSDCTIYVDWKKLQVTTALSHYVSLYKKRILDEWWDILNQLTVPDKPIDIIKRTPNSLHFTYQGAILDILVAFKFHQNVEQHRQHQLKILRVVHRVKKIPERQEEMEKLVKKLGSELTTSGVIWMKSKSGFVSDLARLGKFWSQTVVYKGCGNGKSFFFELVATTAALIEEERAERQGDSVSITRAFKRFLLMIINMKSLEIIFTDNYSLEEIPGDLMAERPLLLNPVNPFQNVFEVCEEDFILTMSGAASVTLSKMRCPLTSGDFSVIFFPQNLTKLNNAISFRRAVFSLGPPESGQMPEVMFNSSWLHPVLSAASNYQKIAWDPNGELRYLLGRVLRLAASTVLCAEFDDEQLDPYEQLNSFFHHLNCPSLENSREDRDVQFLIHSKNLDSTLVIGINLVANLVC